MYYWCVEQHLPGYTFCKELVYVVLRVYRLFTYWCR